MAKISTYPIVSIPTFDDLLIGTDMEDLKATKNFSIGDIANLIIVGTYVPYTGAIFDVDLGVHKIVASAFEVSGGLSTQFLKADGSLDSTVYVPETRQITINGDTYDLSEDREWTIPAIDVFSTIGTGGPATYVDGVLNIPVYQSQGDYITQLTGEASAVGPGSAVVTLNNDAVTGKVLSGLNITGGTILSTDTILQAFGKVQNQINGLFGGVIYQGTWDADTNTPNLQSSVGTKGYYYVVSVPGNTNLNGITDWKLGDWVIFNGSTWEKVDNTDAVVSVNGYTGAVVLNYADVGAPPATRTLTINGLGQDLSADRSWTVGDVRTDGSYADPSWITTLNWSKIIGRPTTLAGYGITDAVPSSRTLTINGTSFDLSADRSWNVGTITQINTSGPITGGPITASGTIGITQAGVSSDGYLSSTDWNTFNNKQNALNAVAPIYITGNDIGINQSGPFSDGFLTSIDWNIFNNKQDALTNPVTGTGTPYVLPMWSGATTLTDSTLSYSLSAYTFSFNTATSASISMLNTYAAVDYSYTIVIAEGAPRSTTHVYSDGDIVQQIGTSQVSRMAEDGSFLLNSLAGTGTRMVVVDGNGVLGYQAIPSLDGYVPYTGATQNVNLGEYGLTTGFLTLDTTPTGTPATQGTIYWDDSRSTAALIMNGTLQHIGQDQFYYVKNSSGATILKGTAVRFAGTDGASGHLLIAPFLANGTFSSTYFMGVTAESIPNGSFGQVMSFGELSGVDTSAYADGDILYASTSVAGSYQTTTPLAPNNIVQIAAVVRAGNNGTIIVRPTLGSNINNDEGVKIISPVNGQVLQYNSTSGLWENATLSTTNVTEGTNLYYTDARARSAISLTTTGSGAATYDSLTGVLNIPTPSSVNLYNSNGTLTGNRTVTMGGYSLVFNSQAGNFLLTTNTSASYDATLRANTNASFTLQNSTTGYGSGQGFGMSVSSNVAAYFGVNNLPIIFGTGTSHAILFNTSGAERMRIFANGNIGINTTTDTGYRFYVSGNTRIFGDAYISSKIGIGTVSPQEELHVLGTIRAQALTSSDNIFLEGINSIGIKVGEIREGSSVQAGGLTISGQRLDNSGGFGIYFNAYVGTTSSGNTGSFDFRANGGTIASPADLPTGIPIAIFSKRSGGATVNQMALFQTGNLLIQNGGTFTDAGYRLDVNGTMRVQGALTVTHQNLTTTSSISDANMDIQFQGSNVGAGIRIKQIYGKFRIVAPDESNRVLLENNGPGGTLNLYWGGTLTTFFNGTGLTNANFINNATTIGGNTSADASAMLDVRSTSRGLLMPRMTTTQRDAISTPATGLQIYNTTTNSFNYYDGTAWVETGAAGSLNIYNTNGTLTGNRTVTMGGNWLRFDATTGAIGLSVQPKTWASPFSGILEFGQAGSLSGWSNNTTVFLASNSYFDGAYRIKVSNKIVAYLRLGSDDVLRIQSAPAGNAGDTHSFTSHVVVASTGNVLINSLNDAGYRLDVNGTMRVQTSIFSPAFITALSGTNFLLPGAWFTDITRNSPIGSIAQRGLVIENANNGTTVDGLTIAVGGIVSISTSQQNLFFNRLLGTLQLYQGGAQSFASTANLASSILSIESTTKGVLLPRMTTTQRDAIASPATGLQIYNTTTNSFNYYDGTAWVETGAAGSLNIYNTNGTLTGNRTVTMGGNTLSFISNNNGAARINIQQQATGTAALARLDLLNNANENISLGKYSTTTSTYKILTASDGYIYTSSGDIALLSDAATSRIKFGAGGSSTAQMMIFPSGSIGINTTTDTGYRLYVAGNTRIFGDAYISSKIGIGTISPAEELHVVGTIRAQALTGSDNIFLEGVNSSNIIIAQIKEASTAGSGGLLLNGQRGDSTNGNGVFFNGFVGTTASGNNAALEFRATGGTIASPADLPNGIPIAIFSKRSGSATVNQMALFQTGNLLLQNGGTFTDAGYKLDVNGTARVQGGLTVTHQNLTTTSSISDANMDIQFQGSNVGAGIRIKQIYGKFRIVAPDESNRVLLENNGPGGTLNLYWGGTLTTFFNGTGLTNANFINNATTIGGNTSADASAMLDVRSTSRGLLLPRMTTTQRDAIASPATGLKIYNTTTNSFNYYNGTIWVESGAAGSLNIYNTDGTLTGNRTVTMGGNWLRFDATTGAIGLSVQPKTWASPFSGILEFGQAGSLSGWSNNTTVFLASNSYYDGAYRIKVSNKIVAYLRLGSDDVLRIQSAPAGNAGDTHTFTSHVVVAATGNVLINSINDAGFRLDVNGTARVQSDMIVNTFTLGRGAGNQQTNTAFGFEVLNVNTGNTNTGVGYRALYLNTSGGSNSAFGRESLANNTTGQINTALGGFALNQNSTGTHNVAIGSSALYSNTTGTYNVAIGTDAGRYLPSGDNTITNQSIFIGHQTRANGNGQTNQIVIGVNAVGLGSNTMVLGNSSIVTTHIAGNVLIGTTTAAGYKLDVNGTMRVQSDLTVSTRLTVTTGEINSNQSSVKIYVNNSLTPVSFSSAGVFSHRVRLEATGQTPGNGDNILRVNIGLTGTTTGTYSFIHNQPTVSSYTNSGTVRGLYINLSAITTGTVNAIETVTGNILLGTTSGSVGIGANTSIAASAILDITSTTKGVLFPRMTTTQRDAISTPATGLQIYNTTTNSFNYYDGTAWVEVGSAGSVNIYNTNGTLSGNRTISTAGNKLTFTSVVNGTSLVYENISQYSILTVGTTSGSAAGVMVTKAEAIEGGFSTYSDSSTMFGVNRRYYTSFNHSGTGGSGILFGTLNNTPVWMGTNGTLRGGITAGGNWLVNTTTDAGFRLDVNGTMRVQGSITQTGSSNTLTLGNGLIFGIDGGTTRVFNGSTIKYQSNATAAIQHFFKNEAGFNNESIVCIDSGGGSTKTSGSVNTLIISGIRSLVSSTATYAGFSLKGRITNNTTTGVHVGFLYDPEVIGSGYTHRAIQTVTGDVILNTTSGNTGIGMTAPVTKLDVNGTFRYSYTDTALADGQYGSIQSTTYAPTANTSNRNLYNTRSSFNLNLTSGALLGTQSYNVAADFSQVWAYGNNGTASTQPIRAYLVGLVGGIGQPAMNLSDFRYFDVKSPDAGGATGHQVTTMYGLRIGQLRGSSNFTITTGYGIYQEGTTDLNYFGGNMLLGTTTGAGFRLDVNGTMRVQGNTTLSSAATLTLNNSGNTVGVRLQHGTTPARGDGFLFQWAGSNVYGFNAAGLNFLHSGTNNEYLFINRSVFSNGSTGGHAFEFRNGGSFNPTTGTNSFSVIRVNTTYNSTGGTNTITGFLYDPVLTSLTGVTHRAIQTVTGDVLLGTTSGSVGIGANTSIAASAILDITSTTKGFLPPRMTTTQRDAIASPVAGLVIFNTTTNVLNFYDGTSWNAV